MNLSFNTQLAQGYTSNSQIARLLTEDWVLRHSYCPSCGALPLQEFENNRPVADFYCGNCQEEFELKSKRGQLTKTIADGAYSTMIERIHSDNNPNFFFLTYTPQWTVRDFLIIPKQFFTPEIIIQRRPLAETTRRAGWVGCTIDISKVADSGKVFLVKNSQVVDSALVNASFSRTLFLRETTKEAKGWILDIMNCVDAIPGSCFTLDEVYQFEKDLQIKHPDNRFIKDKIRQQLQILRDKGIIEFLGRGKYKKSAP